MRNNYLQSIKRAILFGCFAFLLVPKSFSQQVPMVMWFDQPAHQPRVFSYQAQEFTNSFHFEKKGWFEALPIGNGRMGAMVFGVVFSERIQLNEESLWDGYPRDAANLLSAKNLPEVQRLMFEGKNDSAELVASKTLMGIPVRIKPYQSLGDLFIEQLDMPSDSTYTHYRRWLSLDSANVVTPGVNSLAPLTIGEVVKKIGILPLENDPGDGFVYGLNTDVISYLIEVLSGQTLDEYFRKELVEPLEMHDSYFYLPADKVSRLVTLYSNDSIGGRLYPAENQDKQTYPYSGAKTYFSGGAGIAGTIADYANFC